MLAIDHLKRTELSDMKFSETKFTPLKSWTDFIILKLDQSSIVFNYDVKSFSLPLAMK